MIDGSAGIRSLFSCRLSKVRGKRMEQKALMKRPSSAPSRQLHYVGVEAARGGCNNDAVSKVDDGSEQVRRGNRRRFGWC